MKFRFLLTFTVIALLGAIWLGCSKDTKITSYLDQPGLVLSISPTDGSTSVPTSASVTIAFSSSMDREAFQQDFIFLSGQMMQEFMDSLAYMHSGPDSMHMRQMYHQYCIQGEFHWNNQSDTCVFQPGSALSPMTEHMLYLMQHREQQMHMHHNGEVMSEDFMSHFTTADN